jgi:hypothetical protein
MKIKKDASNDFVERRPTLEDIRDAVTPDPRKLFDKVLDNRKSSNDSESERRKRK